jgi:hypothetical protein
MFVRSLFSRRRFVVSKYFFKYLVNDGVKKPIHGGSRRVGGSSWDGCWVSCFLGRGVSEVSNDRVLCQFFFGITCWLVGPLRGFVRTGDVGF